MTLDANVTLKTTDTEPSPFYMLEAIYKALCVDKNASVNIVGADTTNPLPCSLVGSLANKQTNASVTANTNILTTNYTPDKYSKSMLQVMTNTAGVLSLVVDGVSGTVNNGIALTANAWYEFEISLLSGSTYNLQLSVGATMQVKWQVV